jgi:ABC-type glycerol-3-phosphate transport system permease component
MALVKLRKNRLNRSLFGNVVAYLLLAAAGAFLALPLVYTVVSSLKPFEEIFLFPPRLYVMNPTMANFDELFTVSKDSMIPFSRYIFNSFLVSAASTVAQIIVASMAAYPLAKNDFPGKNIIFSVVVSALLFVPQVTSVPQYIIIANIHLINTYWALIFPALGTSMGLFLLKQFMDQIPMSIIESARLDGASEFRIVFSLVFPNVKPAWLTLAIFTFQATWNNAGTAFIFDEELKLLPTALAQLSASSVIGRMGVSMAAAVILMLPPIALFIVSQSNVVKTMAFAGIKE